MNLNGWMRLGIAMSAAWLLVIGYSAYEDLSELSRNKKFKVSIEDVGDVTFVFSAKQTDSAIDLDIREILVPQLAKAHKLYNGQTLTVPYDDYLRLHVRPTRTKYLKLAILPILGLFALGWSVAWVRRGFS